VLLTGGDDDSNDDARSPSQAEPANLTDPSTTDASATTAGPQTAPGVAGTTVPAVAADLGKVTFVVTGGLERSGEFALMSTVPAEGGVLLNFANETGDQVVQVGAIADQSIITYTDSEGIVSGGSDMGCTVELIYDGDVLTGGTFACAGVPGVKNGTDPITADISGSFTTGS
jgi:hypothetical protein